MPENHGKRLMHMKRLLVRQLSPKTSFSHREWMEQFGMAWAMFFDGAVSHSDAAAFLTT